ncbi:DegT/DnrJ/EryC1/StrS family aminotransferase [Alcanivorax sp. S6407]|uniref:DegT/DnrJ/EryC1/StrS family aminotransferase n=1 Tax=Alcanivorax sp. S6407 TaxID=2926424 RepID=UPI001FF2DBE1|nr:DegT/DnrJ/EryC1/StrS family aminotransferase [Alcanivorax sp. S6407]MCK0152858.1 DegT/DnrJ/EryC1/StrS family aminotransferase [Alcanivorax sp. S6407]
MIPVTKPYFPDREKLNKYLDGIYEREWLTNKGQLVQKLTLRLEEYLGVENLLLVANGTLALQIAYRALGISGHEGSGQQEAITTPFTFVATASSLKWDGVDPVFSDIDPDTWCIDPEKIERFITPKTKAIVPVHVFGNGCDVDAIGRVAENNNLKVIYDASHAFGVKYEGESILKYGDAATLSFHATKLFHTGEGGAIVFKRKEDLERAKKMINFGITGPETIEALGINAKMNELQAAMGLCVLDEMEENLKARAKIWYQYESKLGSAVQLQKIKDKLVYNYAYFPVVLETEEKVVSLSEKLRENGVLVRRYFYPSLELVDFFGGRASCPVANNIASRVVCLPIYSQLGPGEQKRIIDLIKCELQ